MPHPQMPVDSLSKAELVKTKETLEHLIKKGHFTLVQEQSVMQQRAERPQLKLRSSSAAEHLRNETTKLPDETTESGSWPR